MNLPQSEPVPYVPFLLFNDTRDDQKAIRLPYGSEAAQFAELRLPNQRGPYPVIILIHGGFWRTPYSLDLMRPLAEDLLARGFATWNIEYRRLGEEGGGWPGTLQDVSSAAEALRVLAPTYALDLNRVVTIGHSAGGHLALWLAGRHRIAGKILQDLFNTDERNMLQMTGAVSLAGVADLRLSWQLRLGSGAAGELLGGSPTQVAERYQMASPAEMAPLGIPQILVHGTADEDVPFIVSKEYAKVAREAGDPVQLIELPNGNHFEVIEPGSVAWAKTAEAVQKLLGIS